MSNIVSIINGETLTTTLAIAEGVDRPHASLLRLVRDHQADFEEFGRVRFEIRPFETPGGTQQREIALLNEHQATLLISFMRNIGVVKEFKKRLVKAFFEMRDQINSGARQLTTLELIDMMRETEIKRIEAEEAKQKLSAELEEARPKVEFHDRVVRSQEAITVSEAAKILGTGRRRLFSFLRKAGWVTRKNEPYQIRIEQGYLDVKLGSWEHPDHGLQQAVTTLVTGKGLAKLQRIYTECDAAA